MNSISKKQNNKENLDRLAAQREIYGEAKQVQALRFILDVPMAVLFTIISVMLPQYQPYSVLFGVLMVLLDLIVLTPYLDSLKETAAKIQELFDCDVLELKWNRIKVGGKPSNELIAEKSEKYLSNNQEPKLKDWYTSSIKKLDTSIARIFCQFENCSWDYKLRKAYSSMILGVTLLLLLIVLILGIYRNINFVEFFISIVAPLLPLVSFSIKEYVDHKNSILKLNTLKLTVENIIEELRLKKVSSKKLSDQSRQLQDEIFETRKTNPLIFDFFYKIFKNDYESEMYLKIKKISKIISG